MHKTGIEEYYALKDGKKLRFGYTTGTCAAAAAKAATVLLLTGKAPETVRIATPKGITLFLAVEEFRLSGGTAVCAVRKDSGDDPDVTDGMLICASVTKGKESGIVVDGGEGVGRISKPGLKQGIGEAAINPVPRQMIREAVEEALDECERTEDLSVVISVPGGAEIAKKTFNPRLGIEGGISILGTSGIVEPMSEEALIDSIVLEIRQRKAMGETRLILTPGNYGEDFLRETFGISGAGVIKCSNFIGRAMDAAAEAGFPEVLLVGHIGKLVKLSGGIMNTHSREADGRAELMAANALRAGADADTAREMLSCVTTDEMLRILREKRLMERTMRETAERIDFYLNARAKGQYAVSCVVFSDVYGVLCMTGQAAEWLRFEKE